MRFHGRIFSLLIFTCSFTGGDTSYAQAVINYQQFTSDNGLSENVVYCLHKDKKGFIWIGTDYGLNRFDGYSFKKYLKVPGDSTGLSDYSVLSIKEDGNGKFWIGSYKGLDHFDPVTGKAEQIDIPGDNPENVTQVIELLGNGDVLFFPNNNKCFRYNPSSGKLTAVMIPDQYYWPGSNTFRLPGDRLAVFGSQVITGKPVVLLLNEERGQWEPHDLENVISYAKELSPSYYFSDTTGTRIIFSFSEQSIRIYDQSGKVTASLSRKTAVNNENLILYDITAVDQFTYWIATNRGLLVYDRKEKSIRPAELKGDSKSLHGNKEIRCLLNDGKGNIWMGIFGEGLLRCDNRKPVFQSLSLPELSGDQFQRMIFGLYKWRDDIIAAETGFKNLILVRNGKVISRVITDKLTPDEIVRVTTGKELSKLNPVLQRILSDMQKQQKLVPFFFVLHDDSTVISNYPSVSVHRPSGIKVYPIQNPGNLITDEKYYWISGTNGLFRLDKNTFEVTPVKFPGSKPATVAETYIYHIAKDGKGNIWMGTKGGGLQQYDSRQDELFKYTTLEGLPDNVVYFVMADQAGNLWLTTNNGISRFNIATKTFTNFSKRDGLLNSEFNRQGGVQMPEGTIYLSGTAGIDYFDPAAIPQPVTPPVVQFTEIRVNNEESVLIPDTSFRYSDNNLSIAYSANDFIRPDLIYYRYRLKKDETWTRVQGVNIVSFNAMTAGHYHFEVQSSYDNLNWSESAVFPFTINAPWWKSRWFYGLLIVVVVSMLYLFYRYRINHLKKLFAMRAKISQDLHDEVGATLSGVTLMSEFAGEKMKMGDNKESQVLIERIKEESKEMAEKMNDIVWAINPVNDSMEKVLNKIQVYGKNCCSSRGIHFHYSRPDNAEETQLNMQTRNNIYLVVKEALNNAVKYSGASNISFSLSGKKNNYVLKVADDGCGFDTGHSYPGNGLVNMRTRAAEIGGELVIHSAKDRGTSIELHF